MKILRPTAFRAQGMKAYRGEMRYSSTHS